MDLDDFAACVRANSSLQEIAERLAARMPNMGLAAAIMGAGTSAAGSEAIEMIELQHVAELAPLREIVDWVEMRVRSNRSRPRVVSPRSDDVLVKMRPLLDWGPLTYLSYAALASIRPTRLAAVVMTCRDDGISLLEWVAHYRAIGFDGIFVYSNDNGDRSDALLRRLADIGAITFIENTTSGTVSPQNKAFAHSLHFLPELRDFEWVYYADSDEFLIPGEGFGWNVRELLAEAATRSSETVQAVCVNWKWMTSASTFARAPEILLARFTHGRNNEHVKSIVRLRDVISMRRLHVPEVLRPGVFLDSNLDVIPGSVGLSKNIDGKHRPNGFAGAQINHYWCKSFEEFLIKKRRGDLVLLDQKNMYRRELEQFFLWNAADTPTNLLPPPAELVRRVQAELVKLRESPGVSEAVGEVEAGFGELLDSIADAAGRRRLYDDFVTGRLAQTKARISA